MISAGREPGPAKPIIDPRNWDGDSGGNKKAGVVGSTGERTVHSRFDLATVALELFSCGRRDDEIDHHEIFPIDLTTPLRRPNIAVN